jgi:cytochrome c6
MKMRFALVLALSLSAHAFAEEATEVWKAKCKSCHGDDGKAKTKMGAKEKIPDMTLADWQKAHSDDQIRQAIAEGSKSNTKMKPFKDKLTPEQIDALVRYIRDMQAKQAHGD